MNTVLRTEKAMVTESHATTCIFDQTAGMVERLIKKGTTDITFLAQDGSAPAQGTLSANQNSHIPLNDPLNQQCSIFSQPIAKCQSQL